MNPLPRAPVVGETRAVEYDSDTGFFAVYGETSRFVYKSFVSELEANRACRKMNDKTQGTTTRATRKETTFR